MAYKYNETPDGVNPMLAPFGKWKIVSYSFINEEMETDYRCTKCKAISDKTHTNCPKCNEYMKG